MAKNLGLFEKKKTQLLWWGLLLLLTVGAGILLVIQQSRPNGSRAKIQYGDTIQYVSLETDGSFGLDENPSIRFEVRDGKIRFIEADCPDKICEKAGFLSRVGETAACLPRKTVLTVISGEEGEVDGLAG